MKVTVAVLLAGALLSAGCSAPEDCGDAAVRLVASCAAGVEYEGTFYMQWSDRLPAERGELLGEAEHPFCNDTLDCGGRTGTPTKVWALPGVDPADVVVGTEEGSGKLVVFGRLHVDPETYFRRTPDGWVQRTVSRPS